MAKINKDNITNNGQQNAIQKSSDIATRNPPRIVGELMFSGRVGYF